MGSRQYNEKQGKREEGEDEEWPCECVAKSSFFEHGAPIHLPVARREAAFGSALFPSPLRRQDDFTSRLIPESVDETAPSN